MVIVALMMVMLFSVGAVAQETYHLTPDDFGVWGDGNLICPNPTPSTEFGWCWNPNFYPIARLFRAEDGSLNMQGNGDEIASVDFAADWADNAVSPHRDFQADCFHKEFEQNNVSYIPQCNWIHGADWNPDGWSLVCNETRPAG